MIKVKRALISVSDKTGLVEFARELSALGVEILSTGGTAKGLMQAGIPVTEVADYTGFPEILNGRVKTLHPKIHSGLLALRESADHMAQLKELGIGLIDMVVVNLYPFDKVIAKKKVDFEEAIENIDVGGPTMLRAAAKNFRNVAVISNPQRYGAIIDDLKANSGMLPDSILSTLAVETFGHTAHYDEMIFNFLKSRRLDESFDDLPKTVGVELVKNRDLRYGENPHQKAAFYSYEDGKLCGLGKMKQLNGKELSFNNLLDLNAALEVVKGFKDPAAVIIKHNNPTGVAEAETLYQAYRFAHAADPLSAFGGIIGLNKAVDEKTAAAISESGFMECVIAPAYDRAALKVLSQKKNLRVIQLNFRDLDKSPYQLKQVEGGFLLQEHDHKNIVEKDLTFPTQKKPTASQVESALFGWKVVRHIRSNAVILVKGKRVVGIGCGQTSRVGSARLAIEKAGKNAKGSIMVSDAFLPHIDNVQVAAAAGVKLIIQTGGSVADGDVVREADKKKIAMIMTGVRHFKH
ncbi:MAG TPA: bifunctional phosphoribosylaminoimidazolecarboxamide formyltransferase/IMP cyclohydrolase [Candidatus Omnitrophota bacterium]|nr:bifunctional phosphoribosylaminoimidazolecarboxamide formyltransferase/IMP cyclohydrolase [Candidatus Omnitrophota bacterium]